MEVKPSSSIFNACLRLKSVSTATAFNKGRMEFPPILHWVIAITNSSNATAWKINRLTGDVFICATPSGENTQAACSARLTQF